jgi:hypothetical protein
MWTPGLAKRNETTAMKKMVARLMTRKEMAVEHLLHRWGRRFQPQPEQLAIVIPFPPRVGTYNR